MTTYPEMVISEVVDAFSDSSERSRSNIEKLYGHPSYQYTISDFILYYAKWKSYTAVFPLFVNAERNPNNV